MAGEPWAPEPDAQGRPLAGAALAARRARRCERRERERASKSVWALRPGVARELSRERRTLAIDEGEGEDRMIDALVAAAYRKDRGVLEALLSRGADINVRDGDGRTALMHAVLAEDASADFVDFLISKGADVNASDSGQRWTALHCAARDQKLELVELLLRRGAAVDATDSFGNTPLWRCVMEKGRKLEAVEALLAHGADPTRPNLKGRSALDIAAQFGDDDVVACLRRRARTQG